MNARRKEFHCPLSHGGEVDRKAGVIRGVSVLTAGAARGHDLEVDQVTLSQMHECAADMVSVPVKWNHKSGADAVAGYLRNFRVDGPKLKADWYLLRSHPQFEQAMEMAERMPGNVGLSAAFLGDDETRKVGKDAKKFARCSELLSVDLVAQPAANPDGLFEAKLPEEKRNGGAIRKAIAGAGILASAPLGAQVGIRAAQAATYRKVRPGEDLAGRVVAVRRRITVAGLPVLSVHHAGVATKGGSVLHSSPGPQASIRRDSMEDFRGRVKDGGAGGASVKKQASELFVERGPARVADAEAIRRGAAGMKGKHWSPVANCEHAAAKLAGRPGRSPQLRGALAGAGLGLAVSAATAAIASRRTRQREFALPPEALQVTSEAARAAFHAGIVTKINQRKKRNMNKTAGPAAEAHTISSLAKRTFSTRPTIYARIRSGELRPVGRDEASGQLIFLSADLDAERNAGVERTAMGLLRHLERCGVPAGQREEIALQALNEFGIGAMILGKLGKLGAMAMRNPGIAAPLAGAAVGGVAGGAKAALDGDPNTGILGGAAKGAALGGVAGAAGGMISKMAGAPKIPTPPASGGGFSAVKKPQPPPVFNTRRRVEEDVVRMRQSPMSFEAKADALRKEHNLTRVQALRAVRRGDPEAYAKLEESRKTYEVKKK